MTDDTKRKDRFLQYFLPSLPPLSPLCSLPAGSSLSNMSAAFRSVPILNPCCEKTWGHNLPTSPKENEGNRTSCILPDRVMQQGTGVIRLLLPKCTCVGNVPSIRSVRSSTWLPAPRAENLRGSENI
ncbi:unnamed protein product [Ectocarpus sp. 12 AP-2014]